MADVHADHQTMTVLHQAVGQVAQLRFLALALADQPGIRIGGGRVRLVAARLAAKIVAIAPVLIVLGPEALVRSPRLQQRAVHREVLVADQITQPRQQHGVLEEVLGDRLVEQPLAVEGERRVIPHRVVDVQADEPAEQQVVVELLHQQPLAAHAVNHLQQRGAQDAFGRDRRATACGVARRQQFIELAQDRVHQNPKLADRMVGRHPILDRYIRKHAKLLDVGAAHRIRRSVIECVYDRGDARRFLDSLLELSRRGSH